VDGDAAQQAFADGQLMTPFLGHDAHHAHSLSGDFGADPVAGQHQYVEIQVFSLDSKNAPSGRGSETSACC
jgi:hypothetical protein